MAKYHQIWESLQDEEYRHEFSADVDTGLAFQIKMLRERNGWTQQQLAERVRSKQETISQWENPNYGSYTLKTLKGLAQAFDVALIVRFGPFSELAKWNADLTPEHLAPPSFEEEAQVGEMGLGMVWTSSVASQEAEKRFAFRLASDDEWLSEHLPKATDEGSTMQPKQSIEKGQGYVLAA